MYQIHIDSAQNFSRMCMCIEFLIQVLKQKHAHASLLLGWYTHTHHKQNQATPAPCRERKVNLFAKLFGGNVSIVLGQNMGLGYSWPLGFGAATIRELEKAVAFLGFLWGSTRRIEGKSWELSCTRLRVTPVALHVSQLIS